MTSLKKATIPKHWISLTFVLEVLSMKEALFWFEKKQGVQILLVIDMS